LFCRRSSAQRLLVISPRLTPSLIHRQGRFHPFLTQLINMLHLSTILLALSAAAYPVVRGSSTPQVTFKEDGTNSTLDCNFSSTQTNGSAAAGVPGFMSKEYMMSDAQDDAHPEWTNLMFYVPEANNGTTVFGGRCISEEKPVNNKTDITLKARVFIHKTVLETNGQFYILLNDGTADYDNQFELLNINAVATDGTQLIRTGQSSAPLLLSLNEVVDTWLTSTIVKTGDVCDVKLSDDNDNVYTRNVGPCQLRADTDYRVVVSTRAGSQQNLSGNFSAVTIQSISWELN
jgi:hypothetical protein